MDNIDIVISTGKNIEESHYSICYTIRSIIHQSVQPDKIIVVSNVPNTGIEKVLTDQFGNLVCLVDGTNKTSNISFARNLGVQHSNSEIVMFMDDDVVFGYHDHLSRIIEIMKHNDFCCGAQRYWISPNWFNYLSLNYPFNHNLQILKAKSFLPSSIERISGKRNYNDFSFIGHLGAINRSVFDSVNGFDESFEGWLYQDTDLMMRLCYLHYSYEILSYSNMYCFHLGHPADKEEYRSRNKNRYVQKQEELGIHFCVDNFFGRFDDQTNYAVIQIKD